jgi:hypothetical protein
MMFSSHLFLPRTGLPVLCPPKSNESISMIAFIASYLLCCHKEIVAVHEGDVCCLCMLCCNREIFAVHKCFVVIRRWLLFICCLLHALFVIERWLLFTSAFL